MIKKKYVDYVGLVWMYGLQTEFNRYCNKHRGISLRRNARNFLIKNGHFNDLKYYREVGFTFPAHSFDEVVKIAKTKWVD